MNTYLKRVIIIVIIGILGAFGAIYQRMTMQLPSIAVGCAVPMLIFSIIFAIIGEEQGEARKNKILLAFANACVIIVYAAAHIELYFEGIRVWVYGIYVAALILCILVQMIVYMRLKDKKIFRYLMIIAFELVFICTVLLIEAPWVMYVPFAFFLVYFMYNDVKAITIAGVIVNVFNYVACWRYIHMCEHLDNFKYNCAAYGIQIALAITFFCSLCLTMVENSKFDDERIKNIEKVTFKSEELAKQVITIAKKVRESAIDTNYVIQELETATNNSLTVLQDISIGNNSNASYVHDQSTMTTNITSMIDNVVDESSKASNITNVSIEDLRKSRESVNNLKKTSSWIVKNNKDVIDTINVFVKNARKVKEITEGIAVISEDTNLLSLNASIKSARAGDAGKGFAVVAGEVRELADSTSDLTDNISDIVEILEENAFSAQKLVNEVVEAINEENETIDETLADFEVMEMKITGLGYNVQNILDKVKQLSNFNSEIVNHIVKLSASSEQVIEYTAEALDINRENKIKADRTKELMDELLNTAIQIDDFITE